jgi:hypothetical protein
MTKLPASHDKKLRFAQNGADAVRLRSNAKPCLIRQQNHRAVSPTDAFRWLNYVTPTRPRVDPGSHGHICAMIGRDDDQL